MQTVYKADGTQYYVCDDCAEKFVTCPHCDELVEMCDDGTGPHCGAVMEEMEDEAV